MTVLGLMSGTSLDGVDVAVIDTDGRTITGFGPAAIHPYTESDRALLAAATADALHWNGAGPRPASFADADALIVRTHLAAIRATLAGAPRIDLVGFHGQTVLHRPHAGLTVQLGDGQALADALGIPVVSDFRSADIRAGGQGAPLVPVYHQALCARGGMALPVCAVNLGGVANITWVGPGGALAAFDTGPGNGLIDIWVARHGLGAYDTDGRLAAAGHADETVLARLLSDPFFARTPPKSLDRYDFALDPVLHLSPQDGARTLTAFAAAAIALALRHVPAPPTRWVLCGGGRRNPTLVAELRARLDAPCIDADDAGWRGDMIEAEAMAFLAARSMAGLPLSCPATTGVVAPTTGGVLAKPR